MRENVACFELVRKGVKGTIPARFSRNLVTKGLRLKGRKEKAFLFVSILFFFFFLLLHQPASPCRAKHTPSLKTCISLFKSQ